LLLLDQEASVGALGMEGGALASGVMHLPWMAIAATAVPWAALPGWDLIPHQEDKSQDRKPHHVHLRALRHLCGQDSLGRQASLKELMARMGQSSVRATVIYDHATAERDQKIASGIDDAARKVRRPASSDRGGERSGAHLVRDT
jgi:hypothetical protein